MNNEHGGNVYEMGRKLNINPNKLLDFSANINPLGQDKLIREAMILGIDKGVKYPDINYFDLKNSINEHEECGFSNILLGNGASEILYNIVRAINPKKGLILSPTFSEYKNALESLDCEVLDICLKEENNFEIEKNILESIDHTIDIMFLCNPNNPTGVLTPIDTIKSILNKTKKTNTFLIIDESFLEFNEFHNEYSAINLINDYENLIVVKSATKFFAVPGLRIGYGVTCNYKIKQKYNKVTPAWNVNSVVCEALKIAFKRKEYREKTVGFVNYEKDRFKEELNKVHYLKVFNPSVNFIMFKIKKDIDLYNELLKEGIIIRKCENFNGLDKRFFRIAVRTKEENEKFLYAIKKILMSED